MTEEIKSAYEKWLAQPEMPADLAEELKAIAGDEDAITDRFYRELEFGTGGLRGVIGAGTNRMNVYNIRKATQGLANYLNASDLPKKVAIGYDSRIKSDVFARETAAVLAANGIKAYIYPRLEPTPALSWAVRYYGCGAGVCVTASHNPAKYNGYKVYGADGCQITLEVAAKILAAIEAVDCFAVQPADFDAALAEGKIEYSSEKCLDDFVDAVYAQRVGDGAGTADLKLVYTPLNGSGLECVKKLLAKLGVTHVTVVPEQEKPDGNFPTPTRTRRSGKPCRRVWSCATKCTRTFCWAPTRTVTVAAPPCRTARAATGSSPATRWASFCWTTSAAPARHWAPCRSIRWL